jgi:hypothetical protein
MPTTQQNVVLAALERDLALIDYSDPSSPQISVIATTPEADGLPADGWRFNDAKVAPGGAVIAGRYWRHAVSIEQRSAAQVQHDILDHLFRRAIVQPELGARLPAQDAQSMEGRHTRARVPPDTRRAAAAGHARRHNRLAKWHGVGHTEAGHVLCGHRWAPGNLLAAALATAFQISTAV